MTVSITEAIIERLAAAGVRHIFGVPGGECNLDFIAAAPKYGVRFVLTRNETAASIMACVASELTGAPGVAMTTRGPGLAAAANGAAYANLDRAQLLLIADGYEDDQAYISHQRIDQAAMLAPVTKAHSLLKSDDPLGELEELLAQAAAQPPGPVYLEAAGSRIRAPAPPTSAPPQTRAKPAPDASALARAAGLLANAKRPLIIAGLQARTPSASARLRSVVAQTGWPVLTTYKAKGVVSEHDAHTLGHYMGGVAEESAIRAADLLVLYGFDPVEGPPQPWRYAAIPSIELTEHAFEHPLFTSQASIIGDIGAALHELVAAAPTAQWSERQILDMKETIARAPRVSTGAGVSPQHVVDAAYAAAPADARIAIDAGAHMLPVLHIWRCAEPNQSLISRGLSTMGFALPAALASCFVEPKRRAIAFTGDGGLMMCLGELGTAAQEGCAPIVVVFNDSALTLISAKQRRRQLATAGVDFYNTDFAQIARGFGWVGHRVEASAELPAAFADAFSRNQPTLIDVVINPEEYDAQILALRG